MFPAARVWPGPLSTENQVLNWTVCRQRFMGMDPDSLQQNPASLGLFINTILSIPRYRRGGNPQH